MNVCINKTHKPLDLHIIQHSFVNPKKIGPFVLYQTNVVIMQDLDT
jgi:hypothetical protein